MKILLIVRHFVKRLGNFFENFDLIQEELDKGLLIANYPQSSSRTRLKKCSLLTDLIQ